MTSVTRAEARANGNDRYMTGKPCANGHIAERYTCNAMCVLCSAMHQKTAVRKPPTPPRMEKARLASKAYHQANREEVLAKMRERNAKYYQKHKERIKAQVAEYQRSNADSRNAYKSAWNSRRAKEDPEFRAHMLMRKFVARTLDRIKKKRKQHERTIQILGYTSAEFAAHVEKLFQPGMSWDNHGKWHVDHIRPLSTFNLSDPEEFRKANSLHNLQPLWKKKNLLKSDKWSGQLTII